MRVETLFVLLIAIIPVLTKFLWWEHADKAEMSTLLGTILCIYLQVCVQAVRYTPLCVPLLVPGIKSLW